VTDYLLDSSALVKRYFTEAGSGWVASATGASAGHSVLLAEITLAEVAAAIAAKQRATPAMSITERDRVLARFLQDCEESFLLVPISRPVIDAAVDLTQRYRLRGYDAVQLATAVVASQALVAAAHAPLVVSVHPPFRRRSGGRKRSGKRSSPRFEGLAASLPGRPRLDTTAA
jgi:predicted nucleic acid-binding protein